MSLDHFTLIMDKLSEVGEFAPWADDDRRRVESRLRKLRLEMRFLVLFCLCIDTWESDDAESMIRSESIMMAFRLFWAEKSYGLVQDRLIHTWPVDARAVHSIAFDVKLIVQQSKLLVEQWCEYFLCSISMQPSKVSEHVRVFLSLLHRCMDSSSRLRTTKVVRCLNDRLAFLDGFLDILDSDSCILNEALVRSKTFVVSFAMNASCLACLYWAKEATDEEEEMNSLLLNMLHKFIPYAPDVILISSQNLRDSSDSIVISTSIACIVDIFFEHLGDDFLILRDPLIHLFTCLAADPFHQKAVAAVVEEVEEEEEEDVLINQIYSLFRDHSYLRLSVGEVKEVCSDKKILLSDFTAQIQMAGAKLRHFYYDTFSIGLEAEKMDHMYFVSVARELDLIEDHVKWADLVRTQLRLFRMELTIMGTFLLCFTTWDDTDEEAREKFSFLITSLQGIWRKEEAVKGLLASRLHTLLRGDVADWHPLASELEGKIQLSKIEMEAWCVNLGHWSFQFKPSTTSKIVEFVDSLLSILNDLVTFKAGETQLIKKIETLEEKLVLLRNCLKLTTNRIEGKEASEFKMFVQEFASDAACLIFLYWARDTDEKIAPELSPMLSQMLQKINHVTPDVARLCLRALKAVYLQQCNPLLFGQTASIFAGFFIENHLETPSKDDFQILHDEVIFLLTFLNDPLRDDFHIDDLFWEDMFGFLPFDDTEGDFGTKKKLLYDFILKIGNINEKIRQLHCEFPESSLYNFPKVVSPTFLDFIIQNLRNLKERMISDWKYVPFAKYKIIQIVEELIYLSPFFNLAFDLQSELNETWSEVVYVIHLTEQTINLCISSWFVFDHPLWRHMANLSGVIDRIKIIKAKLENIKENSMYKGRCLPRSGSLTTSLSEQASPSKINEIFTGFEDEVENITGMLTCEYKPLDIVSIVGMGGSGKTTLAKQVYGSVKGNFDVFAFCSISQHQDIRGLLCEILHDIMGDDKRIFDMTFGMTEDDLAHQLKKCLSRQKYLVVLDNIWDVSEWNKVKHSFPDHKNGSRVMFTTRSREVAEICKINCSPHQLRFMSEEECWKLFQRKVFPNGILPPYLQEIGKVIVRNCKGLPLAVAVIAGLLARTEISSKWWGEVSDRLVSYLSDEGCMKVLELSYNNLPDILKPCLLFLAAFPEGLEVRVKKVIPLWIAEGFIQESKTKSLEDVAKDWFHNLADRNLVIVSNARSFDGSIKSYHVHDLIYELCQTKCRDKNFFWVDHGLAPSSSSDHSIIQHYRVSLRKHSNMSIACIPPVSNARSLLIFSEQSEISLRALRLVQVLEMMLEEYDVKRLSSLVHLRHIYAYIESSNSISIPQSICNLWNIGSLTLDASDVSIRLPETFWKMRSLRHVKVKNCILRLADGHENEAYPKLDKVVSFSKPLLSTGKDVQRLLLRLPTVRKLSCCLEKSPSDDDRESLEILDFKGELESLKLTQKPLERQYLIHFPTTLKKLKLQYFELVWTDISAIAELHCLEVLKLQCVIIRETRLEMEEIAFQNLKYFEIIDYGLVEWKVESLPCLEHLRIDCPELEELPPCFAEISALKKIEVLCTCQYPPKVESSAFRIREEQMDLGNEVEVSILKMPWCM